ncbi:hypothetical protein RhiirA5_505358 [Rhizophagus irregularis]|uniref:Uncharacterized protein n=4 Tax=Rhizophagus irregularis TaxID=588596 RepID=A0A2I1FFI0_9GLOM|nr:hypothetical protein RirG_154120 [Rhizophagus irregularis DAOM 197198w]PKC00137.1 hypothetical protein RhiirA5_505358 [Rhizophagus irregularis]PKC65375.1 hypothetical protein RhiirA1_536376 [Rhizophagus irregularis]PKK61637.1 hypothetical protein RhiirC2_204670 [Rhizophagus irregularis]PKY33108.1 hypothetical protein RhiirB3_532329 [Rhizophagus irregularis]
MGNTVSLNCLIIPIGQFYNLPHDKVVQKITIDKTKAVSELESIIQNNLGTPFNNIPLEVRKIHPAIDIKMRMQPRAPISDYFNEEPSEDLFHVTVYPLSYY